LLDESSLNRILAPVDIRVDSAAEKAILEVRPDIVINCIGVIKQLSDAEDPLVVIPVNAEFPHRLAALCSIAGCRMVHISTDCVFDGRKGNYVESDNVSATDLYGLTKYLGEVAYEHTVTLRTSIIGHEIGSRHGLVEWFLSQSGSVAGFAGALFSGLPAIELARIIHRHAVENPNLSGVYHVSSARISKYDLLGLIAERYRKTIVIKKDDSVKMDRSLDSTRFRLATGYQPPDWPELIDIMYREGQVDARRSSS
jgi:dTDP-4-dehydrorhamnose reductase